MAYLDDTGLAYFWGKIKAYIAALLAPKANDADVVHITGTESITGTKTMTDSSVHYVRTRMDKGTAPSSNEYYNIGFCDKNGSSNTNRFGIFETAVGTDNRVDTCIVAYKNEAGSTVRTSLGAIYDTNADSGYGYVYNGHFRLSNNYHYHQYTNVTKGTAPSSTFYNHFFIVKDVDGKNLCGTYHVYDTDKSSYFGILVYDATSSSATDNSHLGIGIDGSGNVYTRCPHPSDDSNSTNIATTNWVRKTINKSPSDFRRKYTSFTRGTAPSDNKYYWLITGLDSADNIVSGLYGEYNTNRANNIRLMVYKGTDTSSDHAAIGVGCDSSGNWYTMAPTPADSSNDTNIATTAFVKNQDYVTRTTAQTITGTKTFTNNVVFDTSWSIRQKNTNSSVGIFGGTGSGGTDGAKLILNGKDNSSSGQATLQGTNGSSYKQLIVKGDTIYFNTTYCTFANNSQVGLIRDNKPDGNVVIYAGSQNFDGAGLVLNGRTYSTSDKGKFYLRASTMSSSSSSGDARALTGTPTGSIYWNGQAIQTSSDERLKRDFASVDDAVLDGWGMVDWMQFRFKDAFAEKGDAARYHVGLVSQRVDHAFDGTGVDVKRYGIVCHEYAEDYYHDNLVIDAAAYTDEEGVFHEEVSHVEKELVPGRDEWTVRYTEALCMEAAYMRRENVRLKARIASLEDRLAALELRLGSE